MKIISHKLLPQISSASAMEIVEGDIYVCGDDSAFIFQISAEGEVLNKFPLFENAAEGRIAKALKYDFEAMASLGKNIWLFGSGSTENRNVLLVFNTQTKEAKVHSLLQFYESIQYELQIKKEDFNIEGAAVYKGDLLLLNRGDNSIISCSTQDFEACVFQHKDLEDFKQTKYNLPSIEGYVSGFSAACVINDDLIFAASVEKTSDWINDGEILGSFIGKINLCDLDETEFTSVLIEGKLKIEAIALNHSKDSFIALTDNDGLDSEILEIKINF